MITLAEAKSYLRVDTAAEDDLITSLISAAADYIQECTGKEDDGSSLYELCEKILVVHWYEHREAVSGTVTDVPHTLQALLTHIKLAEKRESGSDE